MGFWKKLGNFVRGRGFKEEILPTEEEVRKEAIETRLQESLKSSEQIETESKGFEDIKTGEYKSPLIPKPKETKELKEFGIEQPLRKETKTELQRIESNYAKKGSMNQIEKQINENGKNTITYKPTNDISDLNIAYNSLLSNSTISILNPDGSVDQSLINIIVENREKLQHRFSAEIIILTDKGQGSMDIDGVLAENLNDIYSFIKIGETYTSQELKGQMNEALHHFNKQYGSIGGTIKAPLDTKVVIQDIQVNFSFA